MKLKKRWVLPAGLIVLAGVTALVVWIASLPTGDKDGPAAITEANADEPASSGLLAEEPDAEEPRYAHVRIDFSVRSDPPLLKKIAQYNSGIPPIGNYERDLDHLKSVNAHSFRLDVGMGASGFIGENVVTGDPDQPEYDFEHLDRLANMLNDLDVLPYYSWAYVPKPLQRDGDFRRLNDDAVPDWAEKWGGMLKTIAKHYVDEGIRIGFHEIYNEPDLQDVFFQEPFSKYLELYRHGSRAIREADPDAMIGGPALAGPERRTLVMDFLQMVDEEDLPLDFFSFHHYWENSPFWTKVDTVRQVLSWYDRFHTTEIHLNELSYVSNWQGSDSLNNFYGIAPKMFDVFTEVLKASDITLAHWAQFMESTFEDDAYGIIHRNGRKKAAYNVFKIYADLPEERVAVDWGEDWEAGKKVGVLASGNENKAGVVFWNRTDEEQHISAMLEALPFFKSNVRWYRIDEHHASYLDGAPEELAVESEVRAEGNEFRWEGVLPAYGVVYISLNEAGSDQGDFMPEQDYHFTGNDIRAHYYFEDRTKDNYSYFDRKKWKFFLGMGSQETALSLAGVTAEQLPDPLTVTSVIGGEIQAMSEQTALYMRVDYETASGFTKSVVFHDGRFPEQAEESYPFGTLRAPDEMVEVDRFEEFSVSLQEHAPADWDDGRVLISFCMRDTGAHTRLEVSLR